MMEELLVLLNGDRRPPFEGYVINSSFRLVCVCLSLSLFPLVDV